METIDRTNQTMQPQRVEVAVPEKVTLSPYALSVDEVVGRIQKVHEAFQKVMKEGVHYGTIPGTPKPSLWQPGADLIAMILGVHPKYEVISATRNADFISYTVQCTLVCIGNQDMIAGAGVGSCNSREESQVRKIDSLSRRRNKKVSPWEFDNPIMKMACKRAKVSACLSASAATDVFTQDMEDFQESEPVRRAGLREERVETGSQGYMGDADVAYATPQAAAMAPKKPPKQATIVDTPPTADELRMRAIKLVKDGKVAGLNLKLDPGMDDMNQGELEGYVTHLEGMVKEKTASPR